MVVWPCIDQSKIRQGERGNGFIAQFTRSIDRRRFADGVEGAEYLSRLSAAALGPCLREIRATQLRDGLPFGLLGAPSFDSKATRTQERVCHKHNQHGGQRCPEAGWNWIARRPAPRLLRSAHRSCSNRFAIEKSSKLISQFSSAGIATARLSFEALQ